MCPEIPKTPSTPIATSADLRNLAEYRFEGRNEAEIRGDWIEPLLRLLGYGLGTRNDVFREKQLRLADPVRMIGSTRIEIDFVPTVWGEQLWIMEAKRPQDSEDLFANEHLGQAWSYATDPRISVPYMVLCDGSRLGVFDLTRAEWHKPIFDHVRIELPELFDELFDLLGAPRIAEKLRRDQLKHLRSALLAQVDTEPLDQTLRDVSEIVAEARPVISQRRDEIYREVRQRIEERGTPALDAAGIWGLAGHLNGPLWSTLADIHHGVDLIRQKPSHLRVREFEMFEKACVVNDGEAPRMWFWLALARMGCAVLLSNYEGCGEAAELAAHQHSTAFADDPLLAASYELQRALGPLGWRVAANSKPALDDAAHRAKQSLEPEEWLRLDAEFGISGTATYKFQALFGPRTVLAQVNPWDVDTIRQTNKSARAFLEALPKPPGMDDLLPIGDPWQDSWLAGDPLRDASAATLQALADKAEDRVAAALAARLHEQYFT
jgi:hypothetical protein